MSINLYSWADSGQTAICSSLKWSLWPNSLIQPICFAGFPTTKAYAGMVFVTTAPAPIKAYSPILCPQTIVELAPMEAPLPTIDLAYWSW